jgi:16S rRNA processing protein RimM
MTKDETPVVVGRITAAHGVRGEVKVEPLTDFPERFGRGSHLWLDGVERVVEGGRWQRAQVILKLQGVDSRSEAEALRGKELTVPEAATLPDQGVYYLHDIVGLHVETQDGTELGRVFDVLSTGSNDVYVVRGAQGELLLPALDDVVLQVDVAGGRIVVDVPEGLEFQGAPSRPARPQVRRRSSK